MAKEIEHVFLAVVNMYRNLSNEKLSRHYREKLLPRSLYINACGLRDLYNEEHGTNLTIKEAFLAYYEERKKKYGNRVHQ